MKKKDIYIIGITSLAVLGVVVFLAGKKKKTTKLRRLDRIAEEGYETAADILYPLKGSFNKRFRPYY